MSLGLFLLGSAATAQPASEDPEALIRTGNELRRKGDDKRAEGYLERAYQIAHTPRSAVQLGLVEVALERYELGEILLSEALDSRDSWVQDHKATVEQSRAAARKHLMAVELLGAPENTTATVVDGTIKLPADAVLWLSPGASSVRLQSPGYRAADVAVHGAAGTSSKITVAMVALTPAAPEVPVTSKDTTPTTSAPTDVPAPPPPPVGAPEQRPGRGLRIAGVSAAAVGVVLGVTGFLELNSGNSKVDKINQATAPYPGDGAQSQQHVGVGLMVAGGIAVATGAVLYVLGARAPQEVGAVSLNVGPGLGLVQWGARF